MASVNPLARLFDGADEVIATLERRAARGVTHPADAFAEVAEHHPVELDLTVAQVIEETASTKTLRMRAGDGGDLPAFLAGQYVSLTVPVDGAVTTRAFSISSSPARRDHYDLTVRRLAGGRVSNHLVDTVRPGDRFTSGPPIGTFHHNELFHGDEVVFIAGGSGVAPAMSMIHDIVDHGLPRRFTLLYCSRHAGDIIFRDALDALADRHPNVVVHHVVAEPAAGWEGHLGPLDAELITRLVGPLNGRTTYLCGAPGKYAPMVEVLRSLGQPRRRIRLEANSVALPPPKDPKWPAGLDAQEEVTVTVRGRGGPDARFRARRGRPLLDSLEDHGVLPRSSCRSGECALCRVRICSGEVFHAEEARLRASDERFGFAHSCVAYPLTDLDVEA
ncbi:FAD-binding oxidoreductase [Streptomyces sp. NPDC047315]|uniref:FAD-binding oxidoreductase n=1 Tax=Streptomyces sp. NPDC047315 TaxID=3155142 RepID=UPI00340AFD06